MPDKNTELQFEMNLQFPDSSEDEKKYLIHDDINCCVIVKAPLLQHASYCIVQLNLNTMIFNTIRSQINQSIFPTVYLSIYSVDDDKEDQRLIFQKTLKCLKIKETNDEQDNFDKKEPQVDLLLVHPILLQLDKTQAFISQGKQKNTTASDALLKFENYLKETFFNNDEKSVTFNKVGDNLYKNEHVYDEIFVSTTNDLNVPTHIIQNFKTNDSFCFHFFDAFDFSADHESDVVCHFINLNADEQMGQVDTICEDTDFTVNLVKNINLTDTHDRLRLEGTFVFENPNGSNIIKNLTPENSVNTYPASGEKTESLTDRYYSGSTTELEVAESKPIHTKTTKIYTPDTAQNAMNRLTHCSELIVNKIISIHAYEVSNCLPEFPKFGKLYNIQKFEDEKINHTPFHIINIFQRKQYRENTLFHYAHCAFLKYRKE